jgi:hypothetical protein
MGFVQDSPSLVTLIAIAISSNHHQVTYKINITKDFLVLFALLSVCDDV